MGLILYGSETGNAADLADSLFSELRRRNLANVVCKPFGEASVAEVSDHRHVFVICSTTGQGQLPKSTQPFWSTELLRRSLKAPALAGVKLYSFGLGSTAYPKYNWAIRKIDARLQQLGAELAVPRGEGDELGSEPYEYVFDQWMALALSQFDTLEQIIDVQPPDALLTPIFPLELAPDQEGPSLTDKLDNLRLKSSDNATIRSNERITGADHFQDVRHIKIQLDKPEHGEPGDVIQLFPLNDEATVDAIIDAMEWSAQSSSQVQGEECTLREFLLTKVDLNAIPKRKFFALAQHFCSKPSHRERMCEFASDLDDLFNYTSRPRRSIAEVVLEFDTLRIPIVYIRDIFPALRPRSFSIASPLTANTTEVELCVAIVKYRTILRRVRRGLCTRWLDQRCPPGTRVRVEWSHSHLNLNKQAENRPVILVAAGTGIAPIRSWMKDTTSHPWLFYGCRNERDFLYTNEFGNAQVVPAFSQPLNGSPKKYVQQAILQHASQLPVREAVIFVCGSSGPMPQAVREAFVECLEVQGVSQLEADRIIAAKEKTGLYFQETW